jgi:hypothetical protein
MGYLSLLAFGALSHASQAAPPTVVLQPTGTHHRRKKHVRHHTKHAHKRHVRKHKTPPPSGGNGNDENVLVSKVELRDLSQSSFAHRADKDGDIDKPDYIERNQQKNRGWTASPSNNDWQWSAFLDATRGYDAALGLTNHKRADFQARSSVLHETYQREDQVVSLTGYLVFGYAGGKESCNYGSAKFHDWHLEVFEEPMDHVPRAGDPTGIVCEVTRFTEQKLYQDGIRLQSLLAFTRTGGNGNVQYQSTGHAAHKVRITGYLFWDDEHNTTNDIGPTVASAPDKKFHNPWRQTPWEIHPILKIEDLGT